MNGKNVRSDDAGRSPLAWRVLVLGFAVLAATVFAYFAVGMPGMDHGSESEPGSTGPMVHSAMSVMSLDADEFAARMRDPNVVVINVHVPFEGEIAGTDLTIPYDRIVGDRRLPVDLDTEFLVYCMTGRMSREAAEALRAAGYTDIVDFRGGMEAWRAAGRPLSSN